MLEWSFGVGGRVGVTTWPSGRTNEVRTGGGPDAVAEEEEDDEEGEVAELVVIDDE